MSDLALALVNSGEAENALRETKELEAMLVKNKTNHLDYRWRHFKWIRIKYYTILDDISSAISEARDVLSEYDLNDEDNIEELLFLTVDAVARGVSEKVFLTAFADDQNRLNKIAPLIVALKEGVGETVREPYEVVAVAEAIQNMIKAQKSPKL